MKNSSKVVFLSILIILDIIVMGFEILDLFYGFGEIKINLLMIFGCLFFVIFWLNEIKKIHNKS